MPLKKIIIKLRVDSEMYNNVQLSWFVYTDMYRVKLTINFMSIETNTNFLPLYKLYVFWIKKKNDT